MPHAWSRKLTVEEKAAAKKNARKVARRIMLEEKYGKPYVPWWKNTGPLAGKGGEGPKAYMGELLIEVDPELQQYLTELGSASEIARRTGIRRTSIKRLRNGPWPRTITMTRLDRILQAMDADTSCADWGPWYTEMEMIRNGIWKPGAMYYLRKREERLARQDKQ